MTNYLIGDSHAMEIWVELNPPEVSHVNLHGNGFQNLIRDTNRGFGDDLRNYAWGVFDSLEKNSTIIMSYTDPDSRIGIGDSNEFLEKIETDYEEVLTKIVEVTKCKKFIILDWYVILSTSVAEQTCSPERRIINRDECIKAIKKVQQNIPNVELHTLSRRENWEDEIGFAIDPDVLKDGVHLNFNHERCNELKEKLKEILENG